MALFWHNLNADNDANDRTNYSTDQAGTSAAGAGALTNDDLQFNGTGGTADDNCTVSANLAFRSIDLNGFSGVYNDGGFTLTIAGAIIIPNTASLVTSTGIWIMSVSGNAANPHSDNTLESLVLNAAQEATLTANFRTRKYEGIALSDITGSFDLMLFQPLANDFIIQGVDAAFNVNTVSVFLDADRTQSSLTLLSDFMLSFSADKTLTMTGDLNCVSLRVSGSASSTSEALATKFDMNGDDLTCTEDISIGGNAVGTHKGKVILGSGNHSVADSISANGANATGFIDFDSSTFSFGGSFKMTNITIDKGTATVTQNGSSGTPIIIFDGQSLANFVINNSGVTSFVQQDAGNVDSFLLTAGVIDHSGQDMTTTGNYTIVAVGLNVASGLVGMVLTVGGIYNVKGTISALLDLAAGGAWTLTITGAASARFVDVNNSNAGGGTEVIAKASTHDGSNTNWAFVSAAGTSRDNSIRINRMLRVIF